MKQGVKKALRHFGYEIHRRGSLSEANTPRVPTTQPAPIDPVWPLPRRPGGPSDEKIRQEFAKYNLWHYSYEFEGGLSFSARHNLPGPLADVPERPLQRFRHFMPYLVEAENGSLQGRRILDIACNSGFWSIQCALCGAEVVGFDSRPELVEQANFIKQVVGIDNVEFKTLDFWNMSTQALGGQFDVVLCLGILYHLSNPLEALQLTKSMARRVILLDTGIYPSFDSVLKLKWEEAFDIRAAAAPGIVAYPSKSGIDLMLRYIGVDDWFEIPIRTTNMPRDYLDDERASWLIKV